jgi:DNA-binding CsgD family transcriptional regulator
VVVSEAPPWGRRLPERWVLDQRVEINGRATLAAGPDHVGVLSHATGGDLARCRRWRDFGRPLGMGDELRAAIVDEHGCWGSFELFRASDERPFDGDDARLVGDGARIVAPALRRGRMTPQPDQAHPPLAGVVLVDRDLRPQGVTEAARAWFALLDARRQPERTPLPLPVYGVVGRLLAAEVGEAPDRAPRARVRTSTGGWAVVEAARLDGGDELVAVSIRAAGPADDVDLVSRAHGLTARESELLMLVLEGLDTHELATRMFISAYTVKDHLKAVFAKLNVHSRRELVSELFGRRA